MLSYLSVSNRPKSRLRHWCSSKYLRISPLHLEFHSSLLYSSSSVSDDRTQSSSALSQQTQRTACGPCTPTTSGQPSPPTYYRSCWQVVSRGWLVKYCQSGSRYAHTWSARTT